MNRFVYSATVWSLIFAFQGNLYSDTSDSIQTEDTSLTQENGYLPVIKESIELPEGILFGSFTKEDGTLFIKGNVVIPVGQSLELGPGCIVYVGGEYTTITVFGQIIARGTKEEPVVFMSARTSPKPWDWDRIYCRSRTGSQFEHCIIRHSNYGIVVENGSVLIKHSLFENNSISGLVVKNAEASLSSAIFKGGHLVALNIRPNGVVIADSLTIKRKYHRNCL